MVTNNPLPGIARIQALSVLLLAAVLLTLQFPAFAQEFPELTGRVTDAAGIIPDDVEARLTEKLETLEIQSQRQLVVATIPDLQGYDIADYGYRLGREWGIGDKERNDGALLIVAPSERKVRIEVGYGLEPVLTDGLSWRIIDTDIVPRFKDGDMPGGIEAGVDAIATQLTLPPEEAQRIASASSPRTTLGGPDYKRDALLWVLFIIFILLIAVPIIARKKGFKTKWHGSGSRTWSSGSSGWSSGGFSSSSFSSSSFSGGGGSFGGGGASGSW